MAMLLTDFGDLLNPALEDGLITTAQAWALVWDAESNPLDPFPPELLRVWQTAMLHRLTPSDRPM